MIEINLLPPQIKEEIKQTKNNSYAIKVLLKLILLAAFIVTLVFGIRFYLQMVEKAAIKSSSENRKSVESYGTLERDAKKISERITAIKNITKNTNKWYGTLAELQKTMPEGVSLTGFRYDTSVKNTRGIITGRANTTKEVAALRESLENSKKFDYVDIDQSQNQLDPSTKTMKQVFTISFSLSAEALDE